MLQRHVSGLAVVDASGRLIGIVSEGDFVRRTESTRGTNVVLASFIFGRRLGRVPSRQNAERQENTAGWTISYGGLRRGGIDAGSGFRPTAPHNGFATLWHCGSTKAGTRPFITISKAEWRDHTTESAAPGASPLTLSTIIVG